MLTLTTIIGYSTDRDISSQLHDLSHDDCVEYLILDREDTLRRRLRKGHGPAPIGQPDRQTGAVDRFWVTLNGYPRSLRRK